VALVGVVGEGTVRRLAGGKVGVEAEGKSLSVSLKGTEKEEKRGPELLLVTLLDDLSATHRLRGELDGRIEQNGLERSLFAGDEVVFFNEFVKGDVGGGDRVGLASGESRTFVEYGCEGGGAEVWVVRSRRDTVEGKKRRTGNEDTDVVALVAPLEDSGGESRV
jgi:hypothetical protein